MEMVSLVDFVKSGEVFEKIEWIYDQIVSDFDFGNLEWFVKINNFLDFKRIDKSKKTLFILDKLLYENIDDFWDIKNFCILDMNFGISSFGNKISISNIEPTSVINQNIDIYEPCDLISFLHCLEFEGKNYIRINDYHLPLNFSDDNEVKEFVDLTNKWFDGDNLTLITTGSMLPEIVRTAHLLNENGLFPSIWVLNKLNIDLNSIDFGSKNIVFVLDLIKSDLYERYIKDKLKNFNIKFIYPNYSKISTVLDEYRYQDVLFDSESLFELIKNN